jgi:hypothetical protein
MNTGELLTRFTIWAAVLLYARGAVAAVCARRAGQRFTRGRGAWTLGCVLFVGHVACAFGFYHHWSHALAYTETARQTEAMTGFRSGSGLYMNYAFGLGWLAMMVWWWITPRQFIHQPRWLAGSWHGFAAFMIFNGTIVFGKGAVRWFGAVLFAGAALLWLRERFLLPSVDPSP